MGNGGVDHIFVKSYPCLKKQKQKNTICIAGHVSNFEIFHILKNKSILKNVLLNIFPFLIVISSSVE